MSYFDWKHQVLVAWSPVASAPKHKAVLARTADGETISAENLGEEWLNLGDDDKEMDDPVAWAPHPYVPTQITGLMEQMHQAPARRENPESVQGLEARND